MEIRQLSSFIKPFELRNNFPLKEDENSDFLINDIDWSMQNKIGLKATQNDKKRKVEWNEKEGKNL